MNSTQYVPDADFAPAPAGTRVRLATLLSVVVVFIATAVSVVITVRDPKLPSHLRFIVSGLIPAAFALTCFTARIRRYRLVGDQLRIELPFRTVRFPLAGLVSAVPDREALRGSWKVGGNDGLVVISGRFRSKRLGAFRAYRCRACRGAALA